MSHFNGNNQVSHFNGNNQARRGLSLTPFLTSASIIALLFTAAPAAAQSSDTSFVEDEVIVTARKKEETLQDVSLAISAFSEADIRSRSLNQLEDIALQTPGLTFEDFSNGGFGAPVIRGTSQIRLDILEQNVSVFYDGVYIPRQYAFDSGLANIDRIEVVKGPQSALYGANSFSGAINYVTPERDLTTLGGNVTGGLGLDGLFEARGNINIPLVEDVLAVSVAASHSRFDGEFENNFPGAENAPRRGTDEDIGGWDKDSIAAGITFSQGGFTAKGDFTYFDNLSEVGAGYTISNFTELGNTPGDTFLNCGTASFFTGLRAFCGTLSADRPETLSGVEGLIIDPRSFLESDTEIFRGELNYEFTDEIDLTYIYGNVDSSIFAVGSADVDPITGSDATFLQGNAIVFSPTGGADYETHELRLYYENDTGLNALLGGYYLDGEDLNTFGAEFMPVTGSLVPFEDGVQDNVAGTFLQAQTSTETVAIFGRVEVPVTDRVTISAEARYSETDVDGANVMAVGADVLTQSVDFSAFTPRVNIDWQATDDNLIYASFAQGVKAGGVNTSNAVLLPEEQFFDEDSNTSYEIGAKNTILDGRGTLNVAAYYIDWNDLQIGVAATNGGIFDGPIITNLGGASSKGVEADGTFRVTDNVTLNGGLSYTDATYDDGTLSSRGTVFCDDIVCAANGDVSGNNLARVPEFQWNVGAQYDGTFDGDFAYFLRADFAGQSSQSVEEFNLAFIEGREILNARAGISKGPISVDIWVTNLIDKEYVSNSFYIVNGGNQQYTPTLGAGRRAGVELSYDF